MPVLEVVGGTAAISQLLGQAITIIQKIQEARIKVNGASNCLDIHRDQLDNLLSTLRLVQDEPELQTPLVEKQIQVVISLEKEVQRQLDAFAAQIAKSKTKQYTHAVISGNREKKELENAMARLDRAKIDLTALIVTTHVGLSGSMHTDFTTALAVVQRIDRNVQSVLGERLSIAAQLEAQGLHEEGNDTIPLMNEDVRAPNLVNKVSWIGNEAFDDAVMFNSDLVERQAQVPKIRLYQGNKVHGRGTAVQGEVDAEGVAAILRAKWSS